MGDERNWISRPSFDFTRNAEQATYLSKRRIRLAGLAKSIGFQANFRSDSHPFAWLYLMTLCFGLFSVLRNIFSVLGFFVASHYST